MICFLKFRKNDEQSDAKPEKLIFHKQDGSAVQMTWDAAEPLRNVGLYAD